MNIEHNPSPEMRQATHYLLNHDIREGRKMRAEYIEQLTHSYAASQYDHLAQIAGISAASFTALLLPENALKACAAAVTALYLVALLSKTILIPRAVRLGLFAAVWVLVMGALGAIEGVAFVAVSMSIWHLLLTCKDALEVRRIKRLYEDDNTQLTFGELEQIHNLAKPDPRLMDVLDAWNRQEIPLTRFEYYLFVQTLNSAQSGHESSTRLTV
ncbi:hypothetical protein VPH13_14245 [Stenotrophomonas pavanii]|uniref:hypothetical protein n=1 Tax=Stenotrophomonas pavanii TaxID=487698 RepID=UPI002DB81FF9|nr:hypothetical protein [Stenotrophomonas pavanii]MEC4339883.1 hypothetical protein [Stenotrophomonas pavanii]